MSNNNFRSMINLLNNKLRLVREGYSDVSKGYLIQFHPNYYELIRIEVFINKKKYDKRNF